MDNLELVVHNLTNVKICALVSVKENRIHIHLVKMEFMEELRDALELKPNEITTVELR